MSLLANSNAIETGGYQISRSVRLRSSASAYLNRTPASASNRKTYTFSCWAKRGSLSSNQNIVAQGNNEVLFRFNTTDNINFADYTGGSAVWEITSSSVYRDPSAWYHIVFAVDTTQATSSNRVKVWINNSQVTFTGTYPTLNSDTPFNTTNAMLIGNRTGVSQYFDGYLTEINFIDGQALTPSSFGQTDTITGSWVAKKYTGTYGTNGFYLNFSDNSAATSTTIGKDYSGNGNNFTPVNISVTAGVTFDSMLDVPSGSGYADGGNGRGNYATLNPLIPVPAGTISNGNLDYSRGSTASHGSAAASFTLPTTGKWYWEVTACKNANNEMIGVANIQNNPQLPATGTEIGNGSRGDYGYRSDGNKYNNGSQGAYGGTYASGDVIGVAWDSDAGTLVFYKNGASQGTAFSSIIQLVGKFAPAVSSAETSPDVFNFGQRPFSYTPPTGFKALNTINLSDPTIKKGSSYFDVVTRAGTAATANITSLSFQPDFVWFKSRGRAVDHALYDSVRGVEKRLETNNTDAEVTGDTTGLTAFNSNGYTIGALDQINGTTATNSFVDWAWKANGTGVSNTAGTITSTVSANTTSGFSIVTWTAQSSGTGTVGHGLGVAPSLIIVKSRTVSPSGWNVYHSALGATKVIYLNDTSAAATSSGNWNNTEPTSTVFTSGTGFVSGGNMVSYCFSSINSYSSFGSFVGNGSSDGSFIYLGFRPRWVLIKATTGSNNWIIYDTVRNTYNLTNLSLVPDSSAIENGISSTTENTLDILSNGFKLRTSNALTNGSSVPYIYAAFAENPFKYSNAR